jgi:hypothetical protein
VCDVTETIGWSKVTLSCPATGTSPSGDQRSTRSGPTVGSLPACAVGAGGGNGVTTVSPGRGAGLEPSRSAKGTESSGSASSGGSRLSSASTSAFDSGVATASAGRSLVSAWALPSASASVSPGGASSGISMICSSAWVAIFPLACPAVTVSRVPRSG